MDVALSDGNAWLFSLQRLREGSKFLDITLVAAGSARTIMCTTST